MIGRSEAVVALTLEAAQAFGVLRGEGRLASAMENSNGRYASGAEFERVADAGSSGIGREHSLAAAR